VKFKEYLGLFRIRNLTFLILSGSVSQFGDRLTHMLLITLVGLSSPGRVSAFSWAQFTFTLPVVILSPLVGVLVDYWSRRKVMIYAHLIQAVILASTPYLIDMSNSFLPFWIIITVFFTIDIFNNTAKPALIPNLVASRKLLLANSLDQFLARIATVAGMVIGGYLIQKIGWRWGFVFNASMHLTAGLLVLGIRPSIYQPPLVSSSKLLPSYRTIIQRLASDLKELARVVVKNHLLLVVLSSFMAITIIASVSYTILIFLVQQVLNWGTAGVGLMSGILALGMIIGALSLGLFSVRFSKLYLIILGFFIYGLFFALGPFFISKTFVVLVAFVGGFIFSLITIAQNTILQEEGDSLIRGRIFGIKEFLGNTTFMITALLVGVISDAISYKITLSGIGIFLVALAGFYYYFLFFKHQLTRR
jgi:MFS family permease